MALILAIDIPEDIQTVLKAHIAPIQKKHPEYVWNDPQGWHIRLFQFPVDTKGDSIVKRLDRLLFSYQQFHLYAFACEVEITTVIRLYITFRTEHTVEHIVKDVAWEFAHKKVDYEARIEIARYKIPSKQQYKHLQNQLEAIDCDADISVKGLILLESKTAGKTEVATVKHTFPLVSDQ